MTTHLFSEEPPDGTILADELLTWVIDRADEASQRAGYQGDQRWWQAGQDLMPVAWSVFADQEWQRLYRQSDVDAAVAEAIERTKAGIDAAIMAQMDRLWNNPRLRENGTRCGGLEEAGHIARTWKPEG